MAPSTKTRTSTTRTIRRSIRNRPAASAVAAACVLLAASCSRQPTTEEVDIGDAARTAQGSIDSQQSVPMAATPTAPGLANTGVSNTMDAPAPTAATAETPALPEAEPADDGAEAAAQVLRDYYALIARKQFREAWDLWDREGQASGMAPDAFAASFNKYRNFTAQLGSPGRIDAGAGQRYITIPVTVSGTLRDGAPFAMEGPVTLHRAADIDGATAAQRRWRIYESGLKPRPPAPTPGD
jgi:hypothetical protein